MDDDILNKIRSEKVQYYIQKHDDLFEVSYNNNPEAKKYNAEIDRQLNQYHTFINRFCSQQYEKLRNIESLKIQNNNNNEYMKVFNEFNSCTKGKASHFEYINSSNEMFQKFIDYQDMYCFDDCESNFKTDDDIEYCIKDCIKSRYYSHKALDRYTYNYLKKNVV